MTGLSVARGPAIQVRNLSKNYPLTESQLGRLRHLFGAARGAPRDGLWALHEVTFSVARGEAFGIIGANGSGKSTLLQMIAGILRPTAGEVEVNGRLSALLELGSGFSPEFSGRENVYLNGALFGMSREEIDARFESIERFAEIGDFIGQPVRTYSTGMVLRLAFAVAAHVDPEILIVDEALAVGDIAFRQRCMRRIHELRALGATILFVSHETADVKALCERCLWLEKGVMRAIGEADDVVAKYLSATLQQERVQHEPTAPATFVPGPVSAVNGYRYGDHRAAILHADLLNAHGQAAHCVAAQDRLVLRMGFEAKAAVESPMAGFLVRNARGENIFGTNTARENYPLPPMRAGDAHNVDFHWTAPGLAPGEYRISLAVSDGSMEDFAVCDYVEDALTLTAAASNGSEPRGYFELKCAAVTVHRN